MDLTNKLRVFTAFSGYDSQCMALDRLGINYDLAGWSEIDKYAIQAHNAVYPQWANRNFGDISKIDWQQVSNFDLFTYSFPCTDISSAGQQKGLTEGSGTRSSLLWECRKTIEIKKPKYLLMENVKALTSEKFMPYLRKWLLFLENLGYNNFTKVLNAKDYGVPQNRERVFVVSIYGDERYYYPRPFKLLKRLKDVLESNVDEKYNLSPKIINYIFSNGGKNNNIIGGGGVQNGSKVACCVTANYYKCPRHGNYLIRRYKNNRLQQMIEKNMINKDKIQFVDTDNKTVNTGISGTITTRTNASNNTFIALPKVEQIINISNAKFNNPQIGRVYSIQGISPTIDTMQGGNREPKILTDEYYIRKLTERECFRLMGVSEENIDKIQKAGISKSQQYKMAGNSIVVDILYHIFRKLFTEKECESKQLSLF